MTQKIQRAPIALRVLYALPFFGQIARDIQKDTNSILYALVILITCVVLAVKVWGIVALAMSALALVPVMMITLLAITRG